MDAFPLKAAAPATGKGLAGLAGRVRRISPRRNASGGKAAPGFEKATQHAASVRAAGGRVAVVAGMLVLAIICCLFVNNIIGYLPLVAIVIGVLLCFVYVRVLSRSFEVDDESVPRDCKRGETVDFDLTFVNRSILPIAHLQADFELTNIFGDVATTMETSIALAPRETLPYGFDVEFNHIGTYDVRLGSVKVYDPFGLFWHSEDLNRTYTISVTPHIYPIGKLADFTISEKESRSTFQPIVTDDMDYAGVRDYVPGDPIKSIHWKLSARADHYFTRLFEAYGTPGISVFIDFSAPDYDAEAMMSAFDSVIESAFSMNNYAREAGLDCEIVFFDRFGEEVHKDSPTTTDAVDLLKTMPNLSHDISQRTVIQAMRHTAGTLRSNDNVVLCTASLSEELVVSVLELHNRKKCPVVILSVPQQVETAEKKKMQAVLGRIGSSGIPTYMVDRAADLMEKGD